MPRFRFTLRELFLLVLLAAMGLGWWVDRGRLQNELTRLERQVFLDELTRIHRSLRDRAKPEPATATAQKPQ